MLPATGTCRVKSHSVALPAVALKVAQAAALAKIRSIPAVFSGEATGRKMRGGAAGLAASPGKVISWEGERRTPGAEEAVQLIALLRGSNGAQAAEDAAPA